MGSGFIVNIYLMHFGARNKSRREKKGSKEKYMKKQEACA